MSLYQSYRPKNFSDVVGQDFIKKILSNSCKNQTIHHGYIFFGFHGIGKTTLARIFAEAVNCTNITSDGNPCHQCPNCISYDTSKMIDVIEIDAASYTGVDNIREIIDHARFTPTQGKYKIYIIDEVHMLSKGAFNALLKTLEEPPTHAIFLLATTEIHKIPDTILSRVIRFDLEKIGEKDMRDFLTKICTSEGITTEDSALHMIIHRARGSMRDAITMMEKCIYEKTLTTEYVEKALQLVNHEFLAATFAACESGQGQKIQHIIETLAENNTDVRQFCAQMTEWIVANIDTSLEQKKFSTYKEIFDLFTKVFSQSRLVAVPMEILTMALYERITDALSTTQSAPHKITPKAVSEGPKPTLAELPTPTGELPAPTHELPVGSHSIEAPEHEIPPMTHAISSIIEESDAIFSGELFLQKAKEQGLKTPVISLIKTATIELRESVVHMTTTRYASERCNEGNNHEILLSAAQVFGANDIEIHIRETSDSEPDIVDIATSIFSS